MRRWWIVALAALLACGGAFGQDEPAALDIDGNGTVDALTDGLLTLRYLFGFRGAALTAGAVGDGCTRCEAEAIEGYLERFAGEFDIDDNGAIDALTDGLLILRYLFGFRGNPLTTGVVGEDCLRCDAVSIEARLEELAPPVPAGGLYEIDPIVGNLRYVPAGTFVQGSPAGEPCRQPHESQFNHTLTRDLAVMETEVTRQMWADVKAAQPSLPTDPTDTAYGAGMSNPVQRVTWREALLFANLLSVERGLTRVYYADAALTEPLTAANYETNEVYVNWAADGHRLPTEGEWEYFARAGTATPFWIPEPNYTAADCGELSTLGMYPQLEAAGWFRGNRYDPAGNDTTKPVGLKAANPWGLRDVHGNVWEWVWDRWGSYPEGNQSDYPGPSAGEHRVIRGGDWINCAQYMRSAYRHPDSPWLLNFYIGFRLVRTVP